MNNFQREAGWAIKAVLFTMISVACVVIAIAYTFGNVVYPGHMGIRQITLNIPLGPKQGYSENGLRPGYHWSIPFYSKIHVVPTLVQEMHLHRNREKHKESPGALEVQTTDGSSVDVDVSVLYRFIREKTSDAGGPADLIQRVGGYENRISYIQTALINELKKSLGRLSTSEFYNPILREKEVAVALKELNDRLNSTGILIENILLRRYTYTEQRIDDAIFMKNLQNQEERLNNASSSLAEASAELERVAAEGDEAIKDLKVQRQNEADVIISEADLYEQTQVAKGNLLVEKASASVEKMRAAVLAKTKGSDIYVAKELAPLLSSLKGGVVSELDPYDLDEWLKKLGISEE